MQIYKIYLITILCFLVFCKFWVRMLKCVRIEASNEVFAKQLFISLSVSYRMLSVSIFSEL